MNFRYNLIDITLVVIWRGTSNSYPGKFKVYYCSFIKRKSSKIGYVSNGNEQIKLIWFHIKDILLNLGVKLEILVMII